MDILSALIGFVVGVFTGAGGKYIADKYTDKRQKMEQKSDLSQLFDDLWRSMPDVLSELKMDNKKHPNIRELFVVPKKGMGLQTGGRTVFVLYDNQIEDLKSKLMLLENHGLIIDETTTNAFKYRLTEDMVALVQYRGENGA